VFYRRYLQTLSITLLKFAAAHSLLRSRSKITKQFAIQFATTLIWRNR
jgi:hypothetical protein